MKGSRTKNKATNKDPRGQGIEAKSIPDPPDPPPVQNPPPFDPPKVPRKKS